MSSSGAKLPARNRRAGWDLAGLAGIACLATIACLGATLRLAWIENATFGFDQARLSVIALRMARDGVFAAVGMQSSVGLPNPPASAWLFALPYRFSADPLAATCYVVALNALGVMALGWMARRAWGPVAGLTASALLALSPWGIIFSRTIWAQNLLAPLATLWALTGMLAAEGRHRAWLALHILLAAIASQVHLSGATLWLPTFWLIWRYRLWRYGWALAAGVAASTLIAAPYILAMWPHLKGLLEQMAQIGGQPVRFDALAWRQLVQMGVGSQWRVILTGGEEDWPVALRMAQRAAVWILGLGLVSGFLLLIRDLHRVPRRERRQAGHVLQGLALGWMFASPLMFTTRTTAVYHHYMLDALPGLYLVMAYGASRIAGRRVGRAIVGLALAAACAQAALWAHTASQIARETGGGAGALRWARAIARETDDGRPVVVAADCAWEVVCGEANVFPAVAWGRNVRVIDGRNMLLVPAAAEAGGAHWVFAASAPSALDAALRLGMVSPLPQDALAARQSPYLGMALLPEWPARLQHWAPAEPLTLGCGAQLRAWHVEAIGEQLRVWTLWRVVGPIGAEDYQHFTHLYAGERKVSGHDNALSRSAWQQGDWLIEWADLELPPEVGEEPLYAEIGMYRWPDMTRASILEHPEDGQAAIRLGPFVRPATAP